MLHSSNSTQGSSQGFLQQEAGSTWRFLLPATMQQENARGKVLEGRAGSAAAQSTAPTLPLPQNLCGCRLQGRGRQQHFPQGMPGLAVHCSSSSCILPGQGSQGQGLGTASLAPMHRELLPRVCLQPVASRMCWAGELLCRAQPATSQSCLGVFTSLPAVTPPPL